MKTSTVYTCEICGHTSENMQEVLRCEAQGAPEGPPPWARPEYQAHGISAYAGGWPLENAIIAFGETGVEVVGVGSAWIAGGPYEGHRWEMSGDAHKLSHNAAGDFGSADNFGPCGWDMFRYCARDSTDWPAAAFVWIWTARLYGWTDEQMHEFVSRDRFCLPPDEFRAAVRALLAPR